MRHIFSIFAAILLAAPAQAQTLKSLMYNMSNGYVFIPGGMNVQFTNRIIGLSFQANTNSIEIYKPLYFAPQASSNVFEFEDDSVKNLAKANLGLGATNDVVFNRVIAGATNQPSQLFGDIIAQNGTGEELHINSGGFTFYQGTNAGGYFAVEERSIGGGNWSVESSLTINQTTATNGLLFVYRSNNEPFLGLANLIASNNTTLSNETLFRVGRAEATNQSAQFGFRVVRTNNGGEGFATFSVFGYNALMMIGPSDRSRTNTATNAGIEADIYTITGSNRVMTLRDTNTGALTIHQDLGFGAGLTNNAPTNTTTPAVWLRVWVGTNNYRLPLYQ